MKRTFTKETKETNETQKTQKTKETSEPQENQIAERKTTVLVGIDEITGSCPSVNLDEMREEMDKSPFLPYAYISNEKTVGKDPWKLILVGETEETVVAPYKIMHVLTTKMVRHLSGSKYDTRAYPRKHDSIEGKTEALYKEVSENIEEKQKEGWQEGFTHLVAIWSDSIPCTLATIEVAGTIENYWVSVLSAGDAKKGTCGVVKITSHEKCVKKSAAGRSYLAAWKFKDFEIANLTVQEKENFKKAWEEQNEQIENFLKR